MGNKISRRRDTAPAEQNAAEEAIDTQEAVVEAVAEEPVVVAEATEPVVESVPAPLQEAEPESPKQPETEPPLEEPVSAPLVDLALEPATAPPAEPEPEPLVSVSKSKPVVPEPKPVVPEPKPVVPEPKPVVSEPVIEQEAVPEPNLSQEFLLQPVIPEPFLSPAPLLDLGVPELTPERLDAPHSHSSAPDQPTDLRDAECYDDNVKAAWNSVSVPEEPKESLEKPATMAEQLLCDVIGSELSKADSSST